MFSVDENRLLGVLGDRKFTIAQLTVRMYAYHGRDVDNNYVAAVIRRIVRKCKDTDTSWTITGEGRGRGGRTVWVTKSKGRKCTSKKSHIK